MATGGNDDVATACAYVDSHTGGGHISQTGVMLEEDVTPAASSEAFYGIRNSPELRFEISEAFVAITPCIYVKYVKA
tara:strand:- start:67 stop:297 length:231 start_codon:yes stop_codon:yes gene_type:complete